jgi:hypothetical protein
MARCGCNSAMTTTCDAIMTCIAGNLGAGLDFNETTRQVELRISSDSGNIAAIGTDGGFYAPTSPGPGPMSWPITVATLPAQAMAANGGNNVVGATTAPQMIEYSIANGIEMYTIGTYALADGTAFESVAGPTTSVTAYTDNPGNLPMAYTSSLTQQLTHYDAGTRVNPTSRNSNAPTAMLTPDGGWGGFYSPVYKPRTISETLRLIRGRMVMQLLPQRAGIETPMIERGIRATVEAVVQAGAQDWCIIEVPASLNDNSRAPIDDWVEIVTDAGIAAGVNLAAENLTPSPFTPAEIVATGAQWVTVTSPGRPSDGNTDARITALVGAGLEVTVVTTARQFWTTHAFGLGARVVRSSDSVYARGLRGQPGDLNYRDTMIPGLETRTTANGALTAITDVETAVWHAGFARSDLPGRWFPMRYGWNGLLIPTESNQLLGTICPIPNTTNYEIRMRVRREPATTLSSAQEVGIFFAIPDDRDITTPSGGSNVFKDGYMARITSQSTGTSFRQISIRRFTNGGFVTIATESNTVALPTNSWADLTVRVQGSQLTFIATVAGTTRTLTVADATWRGAYAAYAWRDEPSSASGAYPGFVHGYTNPVDMVMYAPLP